MSVSGIKCAALGLIAVIAASGSASATSFNFLFDDSGGGPDGTIGSPLVGSGTFVTSATLGVGQYALDALPDFSLQFTIGSDTYSTGDIATPLSEVAVEITAVGSRERLVFTENGGGDGGPLAGSLDLVNSQDRALSFEPSMFGGHNLYEEFGADGSFNFGNYLALTAVPEPGVWAMLILGIGGLGVALRRRRQVAMAA